MTEEPLSARLVQVCDQVLEWMDADALQSVAEVQAQLRQPLTIAVVGRVKAGKSTLVNALIGRRVAPTAATECTQVVTWYRFGRPAGAQVVLRDGSTTALPLVEGLPDMLGMPTEVVDHIEVRLPERSLRQLILIDTPGLSSLTRVREADTRAAVLGESSSRKAASGVDAILFVFRDVDKEDEVAFLQSFAAASGDLGATAINAIGVLSHADDYGSGAYGSEDPIDAATRRAGRLAAERSGELADVISVAGLLAETLRTGQLSERAVAELARLDAIPDNRLRLWERLKPHDAVGVDDKTMRSLLSLLGPYGVRHARPVARGGLREVHRWMEERAGLARLETQLKERFTRRADVLKAGRALASLDRLVYDRGISPNVRRRLADTLDRLRFEPLMHRIREMRALEMLRRLPDADPRLLVALEGFLSGRSAVDLLGLTDQTDPETVRAAAFAMAAWGAALAAGPGPRLEMAEAGRVVSRSFLLLADGIGQPGNIPTC